MLSENCPHFPASLYCCLFEKKKKRLKEAFFSVSKLKTKAHLFPLKFLGIKYEKQKKSHWCYILKTGSLTSLIS